MKNIKQRIKYLGKSGWPEELIKQQLLVDYELGNKELIKDIIRQIDKNRIFRTIAGFGKVIVAGILMRQMLNNLK